MIKKANITWTVKQIVKMLEKGNIVFDNAIQRNFCWDDDRKSLLIHSLIENFPIPPMFASKDNERYSMLDGRQRITTIADFMNNRFMLANIPDVTAESGELVDINGLTFDELDEEFQDRIKDYSLTIYYFEELDDEEINSIFFRLNNGKPLSSIELTRIRAKSIEKIRQLANHPLFTSALTEKMLNKYVNEELVIKSWALLNVENPSFETKVIRPLMEHVDVTDDQIAELTKAYDRILETYQNIISTGEKQDARIAKRIVTRTHLLSLVPLALSSMNNNIQLETFIEFVKYFFAGKRSASIDETYNAFAGAGSAKPESIKKRTQAITEAYNRFVQINSKNQKVNKTDTKKEEVEIDDVNTEDVDEFLSSFDEEFAASYIPDNVMDAYANTI